MSTLTKKQRDALDAFKRGKSLMITGPAGCGKSFLLGHIVGHCRATGKKVGVTAMTGVAAMLVDGVTLHSWAGIGLAKESAYALAQRARKNRKSKNNWLNARVLIVDEVSMMDASLFEKLDMVAQTVRGRPKIPFGGLQMVFCGDFAQLKPIPKPGERERYCFESPLWHTVMFPLTGGGGDDARGVTVYLDKILRQNCPEFQDMLMRIRLGEPTARDIKQLQSRAVTREQVKDLKIIVPRDKNQQQAADGDSDDVILPTRLFPTRAEVAEVNCRELAKLIHEEKKPHRTYTATDNAFLYTPGSGGPKQQQQQQGGVDVDDSVDLSGHATKINMTAHMQDTMDKRQRFAKVLQLAVGAQVMLLINHCVEAGLVNGSRGVVSEFDEETGGPIVTFDNGEVLTVPLVTYKVDFEKNQFGTRSQYPLALAWATTIHKSQGATLSYVVTDLANVFDDAQVYVTLSRVKTLDGLFIVDGNVGDIGCDPRVQEYYKSLSAAEAEASQRK
jgi:ATP-dependent DNA helicase PIF1